MTPFPSSIDVAESASKALSLMSEHRFHHLPVTEHFRPVALITEAELRERISESSSGANDLLVGELCNRDVVPVDIQTPLDVVVEQMERDDLDSVLITRADKVAGIFTTKDACRVLVKILRGEIKEPDDVA